MARDEDTPRRTLRDGLVPTEDRAPVAEQPRRSSLRDGVREQLIAPEQPPRQFFGTTQEAEDQAQFRFDTVDDIEATRTQGLRRGRNAFQEGFISATYNAGAQLPAALGIAQGALGYEESSRKNIQRAADIQERGQEQGQTATFSDVREGEAGFGEYLGGLLGSQTPVMAQLLASGGVGGAVGRATAGTAIRRAVTKQVRKQALAKARGRTAQAGVNLAAPRLLGTNAKKALLARGVRNGSGAGAFMAGVGLQSTEALDIMLDEDVENYRDRSLAALGGTLATAGFEALPIMKVFERAGLGRTMQRSVKQEVQNQLTRGQVAGRIVTGAGGQAFIEGSTEAAQGIAMNVAHRMVNDNVEVFGPAEMAQYFEEGIAGALIGGLMGGVSSVRIPQSRGSQTEDEMAELLDRRKAESEQKNSGFQGLRILNPVEQQQASERFDQGQTDFLGMAMLDINPQEVGERIAEVSEAGAALRTVLDPEAGGEQEIQLEDGTVLTRMDAAVDLLASRYGLDLGQPEVLRAAREIFAESEELQIERIQAVLEGTRDVQETESQLQQETDTDTQRQLRQELRARQERLSELRADIEGTAPDVDEDALLAPPGAGDALTDSSPRIRPALTADGPYSSALADETADTTASFKGSTAIGPVFLSDRTPNTAREKKSALTRAEVLAERLNAETGSSGQFRAARAGETLVRALRERAGLDDSATAANSPMIREQVIAEAQRVVESNNPRRTAGKRALKLKGTEPTVENYRAAVAFLDQFNTVVEEQLPGAALGRDQQRLTRGELRRQKILVTDPDVAEDASLIDVLDPDGNPAKLDLVALTRTMLNRIDRAGRGGSQQERQARGQSYEQQGGSGVSRENIARALAAGLSEAITTNGLTPFSQDTDMAEVEQLARDRTNAQTALNEARQAEQQDAAQIQALEAEVAQLDARISEQPGIAEMIDANLEAFRAAGGETTSTGGALYQGVEALEAELSGMVSNATLKARKADIEAELKAARAARKNEKGKSKLDGRISSLEGVLAKVDARLKTNRKIRAALKTVLQGSNPKQLSKQFGARAEAISDNLFKKPEQVAAAAMQWPQSKLRGLAVEELNIKSAALPASPSLGPITVSNAPDGFPQTQLDTINAVRERAKALLTQANEKAAKQKRRKGQFKYIGVGSRRSMTRFLAQRYGRRSNGFKYYPSDVVHVSVENAQRGGSLGFHADTKDQVHRAAYGGATMVFDARLKKVKQKKGEKPKKPTSYDSATTDLIAFLRELGYEVKVNQKSGVATATRPKGLKVPMPADPAALDIDTSPREKPTIKETKTGFKITGPVEGEINISGEIDESYNAAGWFDPKKREEMKKTRELSQTTRGNTFAANLFARKMADGSETITQERAQQVAMKIHEVVHEFADKFGIAPPTIVYGGSGKTGQNGQYKPTQNAIVLTARAFAKDGNFTNRTFSTLVHELSHALEVDVLLNSSEAEVAAVSREYAKWRRAQEAKLAKAKDSADEQRILREIVMDKRGPIGTSKAALEGNNTFRDINREYVLSPREWFADYAARMVLEDGIKPVKNSLALEVFNRVAEALKRFYEQMVLKREFKPADLPALRSFLQARANMRLAPPSATNTKPKILLPANKVTTLDVTPEPTTDGLSDADRARLKAIENERKHWQRVQQRAKALVEEIKAAGPKEILKRYTALTRAMSVYVDLRKQQAREDGALSRRAEDRMAAVLREANKNEVLSRPDEQGENLVDNPTLEETADFPVSGNVPPWVNDINEIRDLESEIPTFTQRRNEGARLTQTAQDLGADTTVEVADWAEFMALTGKSEAELAKLQSARHVASDGTVTVWVNESTVRPSMRHSVLSVELMRATTMPRVEEHAKATKQSVLQALAKLEALGAKSKASASQREVLDFIKQVAEIEDLFVPTGELVSLLKPGAELRDNVAAWRDDYLKLRDKDGSAGTRARAKLAALLDKAKKEKKESSGGKKQGSKPAKKQGASQSNQGGGGKKPPSPPAPPPGATPDDGFNGYVFIKGPLTIEGFQATRELMQAKLTSEEQRVIAKAMLAEPVRRQIINFLRVNKIRVDEFLNDEFDMMALGMAMHRANVLDINPSASSIMSKLSAFVHNLLGFIRTSDQALEVIQALEDGRLEARRSMLFEQAKGGSNLARKLYSLRYDQLKDLENALGKKKKLSSKSVEQLVKILDADPFLAELPKGKKEMIAEDIKAGVYNKKFMEIMTSTRSDFLIDPDKQFVLQQVSKDPNFLQQGAQGIAAAIEWMRPTLDIWIGEAMRARFTGNAVIVRLTNMVYTDVNSQGYGEAMFARKMRRAGEFHAQFFDAVKDLEPKQQEALRDELLGRSKSDDPTVKEAREKVRKLMRRLLVYGRESGLEIGDRGQDYVPWVFDPARLQDRSAQIVEDWMKPVHAKGWDDLAKSRDLMPKNQKKLTDRQRRELIQRVVTGIITENNGLADNVDVSDTSVNPKFGSMFTRELGFLESDSVSKAMLAEVFNQDIATSIHVYMDSLVKRAEYTRTFGRNGVKLTNMKNRAKTLGASSKDLKLMDDIANSALGRTGLEVHDFWKVLMTPIRKTLMKPVMDENDKPFRTAEQAAAAKKEGNYKGRIVELKGGGFIIDRDITNDPARFRQAQSALVVYQNFVLLPLAALTNMADAAGIYFRTGEFNTAFRAYADGLRETVNSVKNVRGDARSRQRNMTELRKLAEELGVVEFSVTSDILGQFYGGTFMSGKVRRANDWFFRANGMEHLTRTLRLAAFAASRRYLVGKARAALEGDQAAYDELMTLGLEPTDLRFDTEGNIQLLTRDEIDEKLGRYNLTAAGARDQELSLQEFQALPEGQKARFAAIAEVARDDRVKQALNRMVDESILRPAPTQRPTWMNDPNWQIFSHLKGFFFTYHERVLRRAYTKAGQGDFMPALNMSSYVVMMLFMDMFRDAITDGAEGDERKKDWMWSDYLSDAARRSGIYGSLGFFPDMAESRQYGGSLFAEALGPTTDHLDQLRRFMMGRSSMNQAFERTVPFASVLPEVPAAVLSWPDYFVSELRGEEPFYQLIKDSPIFSEAEKARADVLSRYGD